ncbi:hypothetical protein MNEG_7196, partial [Monoraphidium neglectum]
MGSIETQPSFETPASPDGRRLERLVSVGQGGQKGTLRVAFAPLETQGSIGSPTGESGSHMKTL